MRHLDKSHARLEQTSRQETTLSEFASVGFTQVGEFFIGSDVAAMLSRTRNVIYLDDGECAVITPDGVTTRADRQTWLISCSKARAFMKAAPPTEPGSHRPECSDPCSIRHRVLTAAADNADSNEAWAALDKALRIAIGRFYPHLADIQLTDYRVRDLDSSDGTSARVRVLCEHADVETAWGTVGVHENIIDASWKAVSEGVIVGLLRSVP